MDHLFRSATLRKLRYENVKVSSNSRRVKVPDIGIGEKLLAVFVARTQNDSIQPPLREITEIRDGAAWLPPDSWPT